MPQDQTPEATKGFGAREDADATRQSQHSISNDAPTDVNLNACYARNYAETASRRADAFERAAARHETLSEAILAKIAQQSASAA